jgi:alkanesulfonate monooxygenase SsuD/methylene tetrahydromethanopterin reductase-like flavin-dependent oxidoreductase (luciferase family)
MKFGIQFFPEVDPQTQPADRYFAECLAIAEEGEALGFTHARTVEHYFHRYGGYSPNPIVFLSAVSQRTRTMRLVTGAVLPVFNNPLKLAGEIGMLDGISHGRLDVGFARAFLPHEFRRFRISPDESQARFREGLEQVELLLTQENVTHRGQFHVIEDTTSLPRPTQKPRPPFYIAATQSAETFEFTGRNGYSLMAIPIGNIKPLIEVYRKAWRDAGHPGNGEVMVTFHMFCHDDARRAREIARKPFDSYFQTLADAARDWTQGVTSNDYRDYDKTIAKMKAFTLDSQIESGSAWIGTPDEVRTIMHRVVDTIGPFEHASLQINFSDLDFGEAQRSMRLFAAEVMPEFLTEDSSVPAKDKEYVQPVVAAR